MSIYKTEGGVKNQTRYAVGDEVFWTSSAAGTTKTKQGKIVAVVPARTRNREWILLVELLGEDWRSRYKSLMDYWRGVGLRPHESYLIAVPTKSGRGKLRLYWPRVSLLRKVDSDESAN